MQFNSFDLDNIFKDLQIPADVNDEIEKLILKMFNFLGKKISSNYLTKLILALGVTFSKEAENNTYFFLKTGSIGIELISDWWDKNVFAKNQWTCVDKNGTSFVHEFGHVLDFFSRIEPKNLFLINSLNIKEIFASQKSDKWKYNLPLTMENLIEINEKLAHQAHTIDEKRAKSLSVRFADYIFGKTMELLSRNKQNISLNKLLQQPLHRYFMAICALIPSNYVQEKIVGSDFNDEIGNNTGIYELFGEAFSFLITANDQDKNIFWEWTYDFVNRELKLK